MADIPDRRAEQIEKRIKYYGADEVDALYADLAMFSHGTGSFTIAFYQLLLPETEGIEAIKELAEVPAKCVSRIVLAPAVIDQFQTALATNIEKFKQLQARSKLPSVIPNTPTD